MSPRVRVSACPVSVIPYAPLCPLSVFWPETAPIYPKLLRLVEKWSKKWRKIDEFLWKNGRKWRKIDEFLWKMDPEGGHGVPPCAAPSPYPITRVPPPPAPPHWPTGQQCTTPWLTANGGSPGSFWLQHHVRKPVHLRRGPNKPQFSVFGGFRHKITDYSSKTPTLLDLKLSKWSKLSKSGFIV